MLDVKKEFASKYPKDFLRKCEIGDTSVVNPRLIHKFAPAIPGFLYFFFFG
jgi:hypothetical protein